MEVETSDVDLQTVVADFRAGDPVAHLRIGLEQLPFDPAAVGPEQAAAIVASDQHVAGFVSFVQRPAEGVVLAVHQRSTHSPSNWCNQRTLLSWYVPNVTPGL